MRPELLGWIAIHGFGAAVNMWGVLLALRLAARPGLQVPATLRSVQHVAAIAIHAVSIVLGTAVVAGLSPGLVWGYATLQGALFVAIGLAAALASRGELAGFPRYIPPLQPVVFNAAQVFIAGMNLGVGTILGLPGDTFALSPTYAFLRSQPLEEGQWGVLFTVVGVCCLISAYFSGLVLARDGDDQFGGPLLVRVYRLLRLTWFIVAPLWGFWAFAVFIISPISIGTVLFGGVGCLSLWVHGQVRREARRVAREHGEGAGR